MKTPKLLRKGALKPDDLTSFAAISFPDGDLIRLETCSMFIFVGVRGASDVLGVLGPPLTNLLTKELIDR